MSRDENFRPTPIEKHTGTTSYLEHSVTEALGRGISMNFKATILGATMAATGLVGLSGAALAFSVTPPGERAGIDLASPLPEGIYFVDTGSVGNYRDFQGTSNLDYNVPIIAWATPWTIGGGRFQLLYAQPTASLSAANLATTGRTAIARGIYNPFLAAQFAYNFGNGFSASYLAGVYIGITGSNVISGTGPIHANPVLVYNPFDQTTFHQMLSLAYHGDGWNLTANLLYGIVGTNQTSGLTSAQAWNPDYFNYDLGITHTFGKWEIGIVAYGSTDVGSKYGYADQSQFALGGLLGYNFGPVITQFTFASDVYKRNYYSYETRVLGRIIIPIWNPEVPKAVVAKY
jgi:hypothetical protein